MNKKIFILALGLTIGMSAFSQGLHKEITVDQQIVPKKRDASRITVLPTLNLPPLQPARLSFSERVVTTRVPNSITTLEPVAFGDKLYTSPYRGYVALGIFPLFNADFSVGYRLLDSDKTRLSAWGQYNGDVYRETLHFAPDKYTKYWRDHTASIGADLHHAIGKKSFLDAQLNYTYGYHNMIAADGYSSLGQRSNRINAGVTFNSHTEGLMYAIGLDYQHFGFGDPTIPSRLSDMERQFPYTPVKQNLFGGSAKGLLPMGEHSYVGIDGKEQFLTTSEHYIPVFPFIDTFYHEGDKKTGLISATPYYLYTTGIVSARLGARIDFTLKNGKVFHIAPDISLAWTPTQVIGLELRAHGGSKLNSLAELYDVAPYINGAFFYSQSHIPYAVDGKVVLGPFLGASVEFFGGYAKADKWLMPVMTTGYISGQAFDPVDLSGWHLGAAIGYTYRKIASAKISYETAPNDYDNAYYEWRDRAKHVINAELSVRPIKPLLVSLNWEFRGGRRTYGFHHLNDGSATSPSTGIAIHQLDTYSLRAASTLNLGASYEYTDRLTFFARGENILNRRYYHLGQRLSQGFTGLVGASLKF